MSAPAIAIPFEVFHPAGSPSVVMIAHGLLDSAIGYVIVDNPFALKNNPHCLIAYCQDSHSSIQTAGPIVYDLHTIFICGIYFRTLRLICHRTAT